jgi:hypothetical protein
MTATAAPADPPLALSCSLEVAFIARWERLFIACARHGAERRDWRDLVGVVSGR